MPTTTARGRGSLLAALAVALVALLGLTACGGQAEGSDVATAGDSTAEPEPSATPDESADPDEAALEFAECMRENGVDMPDPEPGQNGGFQLFGGGTGDVDQATLERALEACRDLAPQLEGGAEIDPEMEEQMLALAECMREHGIDMPDPTTDGGLSRFQLPDGVDREEVDAAMEECRETVDLPEPGELQEESL
jgi:hypothetical protein